MISYRVRCGVLLTLLGSAALPTRALSGQITYLAVASGNAGHMLRAAYRNGRLVSVEVSASVLGRGVMLEGLSMRGQPVRVRVDSINADYEPPDPEFHVTVHGPLPPDPSALLYDSVAFLQGQALAPQLRADSAARNAFYRGYADLNQRWLQAYGAYGTPRAVLMWSGRQAPRYVSPEPVALDTALERVVHYAADSLWQRALRDLPSKDQEVGYRFGRQEALRVSERPGIVFIWRQAISSAGDPRGSFFFVINSRDGALVVATFGHPEWSPNSDIVQIRPYLFFKIGHDSRIFLLAQRSRAWEDYSGGWAILEASNGRVVGSSH